jgi:hypothetical protein
MQLTNLDPSVIEAYESPADSEYKADISDWTAGHLEEVSKLEKSAQINLMESLYNSYIVSTISDLRTRIDTVMHKMSAAIWPLDEEICDITCTECTRRKSQNPSLFDDAPDPENIEDDRCLDTACWNQKYKQFLIEQRRLAERQFGPGRIYLVTNEHWIDAEHPAAEIYGEGRILTGYDWEEAADDAPGEEVLPALNIDTGRILWIIKTSDEPADDEDDTEPSPTPLAERRDKLYRKRWAQVIEELQENMCDNSDDFGYNNIHTTDPEMRKIITIVLGASVGTLHTRDWADNSDWEYLQDIKDKIKEMDAIDALYKKPVEGAIRDLWRAIVPVLGSRLAYRGPITQTPDLKIKEARHVADLFGIDIDGMYDDVASRDKFQAPKSWADLNEDGTPK